MTDKIWILRQFYGKNDDYTHTVEGECFVNLMDLCFDSADCFSLKRASWSAFTDKQFELELEPFKIKELRMKYWYGYNLLPEHLSAPPMEIILYDACEAAREVVLKYNDNLFLEDRRDGKLTLSSKTLEDICFFKDKSLFLGTVSHEYMCSVNPVTLNFEERLLSTGDWELADCDKLQKLSIDGML